MMSSHSSLGNRSVQIEDALEGMHVKVEASKDILLCVKKEFPVVVEAGKAGEKMK